MQAQAFKELLNHDAPMGLHELHSLSYQEPVENQENKHCYMSYRDKTVPLRASMSEQRRNLINNSHNNATLTSII